MTTATKSRKAQKTVQVLSRIEFKADSRKVCYQVRASNGTGQYTTCLFDGKATSCTCKATVKCYHMTQLEQKEAARHAVAEAETIVTSTLAVDKQDGNNSYFDAECKAVNRSFDAWSKAHGYPALPQIIDEEYEQWKRDNGLDGKLSREAYTQEFSIY